MWTREVPSTSTTSAVSPEVSGAPQPLQGPSSGTPDSLESSAPQAPNPTPGAPCAHSAQDGHRPSQFTGQSQVEAPVCGQQCGSVR